MDDGSASEDPSQNLEKGSITETGSVDLQQKQTNEIEETKSPAAPDVHPVGDVSSSWRMVLHEESNQYYYWNIDTGETSWEVPDILAQANVLIEDTEGRMGAVIDTCKSSTPLDMEEGEMNSRQLSADSMVNCQTSEGADQGTKPDESNEDEEDNRDASQSIENSLPGRHSVESNGGTELTDLSSKLIKHCESLLERLNSVKGLNCHLESQDLKMKCTVEIETRLADIMALASHGLSLLPFWQHSEDQIKQLEAAVDSVIQCSNSSSLGEIEASVESHEGVGDDTEIGASEKKARFTVVELLSENPATKSNYEANNGGVTTPEQLPSACYLKDVGVTNVKVGIEMESELASRPALHSGEDVDMDVDMEVDETSSVKSPHEELFSVALPSEEWIPPPPPDNEPFPPPPPDDEPLPPSPPDESPESSYPPLSHLGSVQLLSYPEQYTLSYPGSNLEYYGQTNLEVPGSGTYMHPDGGQLAVSHIPHYYGAAANVYAVAPVLVNPVEPTTYYGLQNGTLNPISLISGVAESSGTTTEPVPVTLDSGTVGPMDYYPEAGSSLLPETNLSVVKSGDAMVKAGPSGVPEARFSTGAPATSSVANGDSVLSTCNTNTSVPVAAAAAAAATSKSQSKVPRSKKRSVAVVSTLRSNKKVSSLVDKWKAAKEELHEEEEEPEDTYEILERKRKREIEQWRAQQIASGEAKDNANFLPLGGDWRERVKRKRAQQMKESKQSSPDVITTDGNQQADLVELSKGLPSGWQVYWDDSSEQVYYGNARTSETTWTRPTD